MADQTPKQIFLDMAARIERNDPAEFGGVMLIVPPVGEPVEYFFVTTHPENEEVFFWAQCKAKIDATTDERVTRLAAADPWQRQRR